MTLRPTPDPEVVPLLRAIKARIEGLGSQVNTSPKDGVDVFYRNKTPFLQLEIRRDHMSLDLWLPPAQLDEARASGIARAHPFLGDEAVKVRFERAEDLSRVARWIEASFAYAPDRAKKGSKKKPVEKTTPLIKSMPPAKATPSAPSAPAAPAESAPKNGAVAKTAAPAEKKAKAAAKPARAKKAKATKKAKTAKPARKPAARREKAAKKARRNKR